jgi:hypothetical protein
MRVILPKRWVRSETSEIVSIGSGIERKPILEQDLESADGGQDSELLQGGAVRLGHEGSGADTVRRCRAGQAIRKYIGGDVNEQRTRAEPPAR